MDGKRTGYCLMLGLILIIRSPFPSHAEDMCAEWNGDCTLCVDTSECIYILSRHEWKGFCIHFGHNDELTQSESTVHDCSQIDKNQTSHGTADTTSKRWASTSVKETKPTDTGTQPTARKTLPTEKPAKTFVIENYLSDQIDCVNGWIFIMGNVFAALLIFLIVGIRSVFISGWNKYLAKRSGMPLRNTFLSEKPSCQPINEVYEAK